MKIEIAGQLKPFSHEPPIHCLLPYSDVGMIVYPAHLTLISLSHPSLKMELDLSVVGPIYDFTVTVELQSGKVIVFGTAKTGFFRYVLRQKEEGIAFILEKGKTLTISGDLSLIVTPKQPVLLPFKGTSRVKPSERLACGVNKSSDWNAVVRRRDFLEIFPFWLKMGRSAPEFPTHQTVGAFTLLQNCADLVKRKQKEGLLEAFSDLFQVAFTGIFFPHAEDPRHQGILKENKIPKVNPLPLLTESAKLIFSLFFEEDKDRLSFLPCLPSHFTVGRMTGIITCHQDLISFEWTKYTLRKLVIEVRHPRTVELQFPKSIKSCRVRRSLREKGTRAQAVQGQLKTHLPEGKIYFDRFEN